MGRFKIFRGEFYFLSIHDELSSLTKKRFCAKFGSKRFSKIFIIYICVDSDRKNNFKLFFRLKLV